jgi:hypothetical protein
MTKHRELAISILETVAEKLGDETIFDCKVGNSKWFDFEDLVTEIIEDYYPETIKEVEV